MPELRYQTIGEMRTDVETVIKESASARAPAYAESSAPRLIDEGTSYVSTLEQLATFEGQFGLSRRKHRMVLDDRRLAFVRAGTTTTIPLAAILDLSIGRYPRGMNPVGLDFISVIYDDGGQKQSLLFTPFERAWGLPGQFNEYVAEWFDAIHAAVVAATGRAPGNTPAELLGTPSSSLGLLIVVLAPWLLVAGGFIVSAGLSTAWTLALSAPLLIGALGAGGLLLVNILNGKLSRGTLLMLLTLCVPIVLAGAMLVLMYFLLHREPPYVQPPMVKAPRFRRAPSPTPPVRPPTPWVPRSVPIRASKSECFT